MANLEWEVAHRITSPLGNLDLNVTDPVTLRRYQIIQAGYVIDPTLRVTSDNKSQADGSVLHPRYKTGMNATLTVQFQIQNSVNGPDFVPACQADLREMNDELLGHLNALRSLSTDTQRLIWTPTGYGDNRMLDQIQTLAWATPSRDETITQQTFSFESPFPYEIDETEIDTTYVSGATHAIPNDGSADFFPVMRVEASTAFTIEDTVSGLKIVYDSSRPGAVPIGGTNYGEIDFFRGTIFLNGDSTDLIAGIDPALSDFFPIPQAGGTTVSITGAAMTVLSNNAWS
jgi:hypothetical protein